MRNAEDALENAEERYKQGTLGLVDWMLAKENLSKDQKQDLTFAREVLVNASEEDFSELIGEGSTGLPESRNNKVIVTGDEKDATNLDNLLKSIEVMKKINEVRASDDNYTGEMKRNASYTNFYFMATAEAGAMRGAGLMQHSVLTTSCENLAFGYRDDPTRGWYTREKASFDEIKNDLGISKITGEADIKKIANEADSRGVVIGHYTNLFYAADQVMGVGYTPYARYYRGTFCYNASKSSNYTNARYNRAMHLYTVEQFETLVKEYYASADKTKCEETLEAAKADLFRAESSLQELRDGREAAIADAVKEKAENLSARKTESEFLTVDTDCMKLYLPVVCRIREKCRLR